jgi:hypothetical protein
MMLKFRPSGAASVHIALIPMAYAMGYRSLAAPRLALRRRCLIQTLDKLKFVGHHL